MNRPEMSISGAGAVTALGDGCQALADALAAGRDGIREIHRFEVEGFSTRVAALCPDRGEGRPVTAIALAVAAAREAWEHARLPAAGYRPERVAVVLGTCFGEKFEGFSELTEAVAAAVGARGPCITVSTACSSSTSAVGIARDLVERGMADVALAGGADILTREVFAGFQALGALSAGKCAPFSEPPGTTLGEGAGFVAIEPVDRARSRGVSPLALVLGYGVSGDAFHEAAPDPTGSGLARAIRAALEDAEVTPEQLDHVSAHGTGTESNDRAESRALRAALGPRADAIPVSASKSFLGHAQGAAGVLELICALLCARDGAVPPTLRCQARRPGTVADPVPESRPRPHPVERMLKVSAAFGGANSALVVGRHDVPRKAAARREVYVAGAGAVSPAGTQIDALMRARGSAVPLSGAVGGLDLAQALRAAPPRDFDPSTRLLAAAAGLALADAGISVRGAARDRSGLFTGISRVPCESVEETRRSIDRRGIRNVAVGPFCGIVLNAPAGHCARLFSLRGPLLALSAGRGSGLLSILWAAEHLAQRKDADLIVAAGLDELPGRGARPAQAEGAGAVALTARRPERGGARVERWAITGPGAAADAVSRVVGNQPVDGALTDGVEVPELAGAPFGTWDVRGLVDAESAASAIAFVLAAAAIQRGLARRLLVVSGGNSLSCAAVIAAGG
ncbi:MAG TPA: beta-ketoacyl synthase N-terminal-like domain-containing protein [Myxococcales bacterium]|nr:beta-ketoacyl synthase N-terminal-like domain-containing protein [Myxococcales bacterium]